MGSGVSADKPTFKAMQIEHGSGVQSGLVAVTGATGFIGSHIVKKLLHSGYNVRACVRDPSNKEKLAHLNAMTEAKECKGTLNFAAGDLLTPGSYDDAFSGCDAVIHCAAVVSNKNAVKDPIKDIVDPSVKGSENVYASVNKCPSVKRVVHTSSLAAIQTYDKKIGHEFDEKDWNDWSSPDNGDYYGIAKVQAESIAHRAAEDQTENKGRYDVVVINPGIVFGECLTKAHTKASPVFIRQLIFGNPQPDVCVSYVDVRDVATAHVQALKTPEAGGQRFLLVNDSVRFPQLTESLRALYPQYLFTFHPFNGFLFNIAWYTTMSEFERVVIETDIKVNNAKSKEVLGIEYTPLNDTLQATVDSMVPKWVKATAKE